MSTKNPKQAVIYKTMHGKLYLCGHCSAIHLEFGNLSLTLDIEGLELFRSVINSIEIKREKNDCVFSSSQKYSIPLYQKKLHMLLKQDELEEMKNLLNNYKQAMELVKKGIESEYSLN